MKKKPFTDLGPGLEYDDQPQIQTLDEEYQDSTTVFDLVHRGRQRDQHYRQLRKKSNQVQSPKIMTGMSSIMSEKPIANSRSTRGLGRNNLNKKYGTGKTKKEHK